MYKTYEEALAKGAGMLEEAKVALPDYETSLDVSVNLGVSTMAADTEPEEDTDDKGYYIPKVIILPKK
ncbi:MAG: hypothetical protein SNH27_05005 [Rikenellaceae bacterium]